MEGVERGVFAFHVSRSMFFDGTGVLFSREALTEDASRK